MKKRLISIVCLVAVMVSSFCVGLYAAGGKEEVKAWLRHDLNVEYNGVQQKMRDATGATVLPLTYNDSTYLPVRAISNLLGVHVDWDGDTNTVLLGAKYDFSDFINAIEPYSASKSWAVTKEEDRKDKNIGGINSKSYITIGSRAEAYYNLEAYKNEADFLFFATTITPPTSLSRRCKRCNVFLSSFSRYDNIPFSPFWESSLRIPTVFFITRISLSSNIMGMLSGV